MNYRELKKQLNNFEEDLIKLQSGEGEITTKVKGRKIIPDNKGQNRIKLIESVKVYIEETSKELFEASKKDNIYFSFCAFSVYKKTYKNRLHISMSQDNNKIYNELEFIDSEIQYLHNLKANFKSNFYHDELINPFDKKFKFLEEKQFKKTIPIDNNTPDLSNANAKEKIIFLHELGILDFLKDKSPYNTSTNKLATILSAITGIKSNTIQPYINPINNPQANQNKNPLNDTDAVSKVQSKILNI